MNGGLGERRRDADNGGVPPGAVDCLADSGVDGQSVPDASIRRVWFMPRVPVTPWTMALESLVSLVSQIAMAMASSGSGRGQVGGVLGGGVHGGGLGATGGRGRREGGGDLAGEGEDRAVDRPYGRIDLDEERVLADQDLPQGTRGDERGGQTTWRTRWPLASVPSSRTNTPYPAKSSRA
ncbi:hypothetical protein AB0D04_41155 [Streptomyces sp. NPDC048483]|uniref:hypothetical protein n=1 Tax=Streptomyces sp. NPDC048483 TaxID=3154927 RepID=UPI003428931B